jgi:RNA polymerase sigma factor (sigma-70 family)
MQDEVSLLTNARNGDYWSFDLLLEPYTQRAYRIAYLITHDPDSASDALQEALIRTHRSLRNLREGCRFYPWFARIVTNEAIKQAKRHPPYLPLPEWTPSSDSPERTVLDREAQEELWKLIQSLSPAHRTVIVLRYYDDMSESEIANVLGISLGTVKSRLHYAKNALGKQLRRAERPVSFLGRLSRALQGGL